MSEAKYNKAVAESGRPAYHFKQYARLSDEQREVFDATGDLFAGPEALEPTPETPTPRPAPEPESDPHPVVLDAAELKGWTVAELKAKAEELELGGYSSMRKAELVALIVENQPAA